MTSCDRAAWCEACRRRKPEILESTVLSTERRNTPTGEVIVVLREYVLKDGRYARDVCDWQKDGQGGFIPNLILAIEG